MSVRDLVSWLVNFY